MLKTSIKYFYNADKIFLTFQLDVKRIRKNILTIFHLYMHQISERQIKIIKDHEKLKKTMYSLSTTENT